jgi:hypothetical protein
VALQGAATCDCTDVSPKNLHHMSQGIEQPCVAAAAQNGHPIPNFQDKGEVITIGIGLPLAIYTDSVRLAASLKLWTVGDFACAPR